jgi:hypothetical protein
LTDEEVNAEPFRAVLPGRSRPEAADFSQPRHIFVGKLVRRFGMNSFARVDGNPKIRATYPNGHALLRFQK